MARNHKPLTKGFKECTISVYVSVCVLSKSMRVCGVSNSVVEEQQILRRLSVRPANTTKPFIRLLRFTSGALQIGELIRNSRSSRIYRH